MHRELLTELTARREIYRKWKMGVNIKGVNYKWLKPAEIRKAKTQGT